MLVSPLLAFPSMLLVFPPLELCLLLIVDLLLLPLVLYPPSQINTIFSQVSLKYKSQRQDFIASNIDFEVRYCQSTSGAVSILSGSSQVQFTNVVFNSNHATQSGGAIFSQSFVLDIENCTFKNNSASQNGGALAVQNQQGLTVYGSVFTNNTADTGAAIYVSNVYVSKTTYSYIPLMSNTFTYNTATKQAGAFFGTFTSGNVTQEYDFTGSLFNENCATSAYSDSVTVQLRCASSGSCLIDANNGSVSGCLGVYKPPVASSDEHSGKHNKDKAIIIGVVVPFGILAILSIALFVYISKRHNAEMSKRDEFHILSFSSANLINSLLTLHKQEDFVGIEQFATRRARGSKIGGRES